MMKRRFSLADLIGASVITMLVLSLLLTDLQRRRDAARSISCQNNLKQVGLAIHNYHSAYKQLPAGCGGTVGFEGSTELQSNQKRLSPFVPLTPFMEHQPLWEMISNPYRAGSRTFPPMGPVPWHDPQEYKPWSMRPDLLQCPNEVDGARYSTVASYVVNYGDAVDQVGIPFDVNDRRAPDFMKMIQVTRATNRGVFSGGFPMKFRDILDGLSNTLMFSEARIGRPPVARGVADLELNPSLCLKAAKDSGGKFWPAGRDASWADGCLRSVGFQTILPPNSSACSSEASDLGGVFAPSSYHAGGAHVVFADGKVQFVLDSIDAGDPTRPTVGLNVEGYNSPKQGFASPGSKSPYGLWGALGSRASKETIEERYGPTVDPPRELTDLEKREFARRPLQSWKAANGRGSIKARFIDIEREQNVILMYEKGDIRRVPLSKFASADAYRAVEQYQAELVDAKKRLLPQLSRGVELLDQRKTKEFAALFLATENAYPIVDAQRGLLIHHLETLSRVIQSGLEPPIKRDDSGRIELSLKGAQGGMRQWETLVFLQDRWQFDATGF